MSRAERAACFDDVAVGAVAILAFNLSSSDNTVSISIILLTGSVLSIPSGAVFDLIQSSFGGVTGIITAVLGRLVCCFGMILIFCVKWLLWVPGRAVNLSSGNIAAGSIVVVFLSSRTFVTFFWIRNSGCRRIPSLKAVQTILSGAQSCCVAPFPCCAPNALRVARIVVRSNFAIGAIGTGCCTVTTLFT